MDADAFLFRPPAALAALDLLPMAMPSASTNDAEPKTHCRCIVCRTESETGAALAAEALPGQPKRRTRAGICSSCEWNGASSLQHDGSVELTIRSETPKPQDVPPMQMPAGRRASTLAVLSVSEIQDLADQIHTLSKPLAGMDPQIEVRITVKTNLNGDLTKANTVLEKIKAGWKL